MRNGSVCWINPTLLFALFALSIITCHAMYYCPRDGCETCISVDVYDAPGVGFDLTPSYGTSAVHYTNGTVVDVIQIHGKPEYLELMTRLAKEGKPNLIGSQGTIQKVYFKVFSLLDSILGFPFSGRAGWRWLNEKLQRPVEMDDITVLGEMLWDLKLATEMIIQQDLERIAVTSPDIQTLSPAMINTALQELDLQTWTGDCPWYPGRLIEADTVYAAGGSGLCKDYHDLWGCSDEFESSGSPIILFVSFTRHALYTSITIPINGEALLRFANDEIKSIDFELGLDRILEADEQDLLWARLRAQIKGFALSSGFRISDILLAGESATNPLFLANLKEALSELLDFYIEPRIAPWVFMGSTHEQKDIELTFAAARGAALYARRRQEVQCDCSESKECESPRQRERFADKVKLDL